MAASPSLWSAAALASVRAIMRQMAARLARAGAGRRRHLDLRLQHLGHHAVAEQLMSKIKEFLVDTAHGAARARVEHEIFLFHADRIHARDNPAGRARFPLRTIVRERMGLLPT